MPGSGWGIFVDCLSMSNATIDTHAYKTWLLSYRYKGADWSMQIIALDADDAMQRVKMCAAFGKVDGELMETIPAFAGAGLLTRIICWWRNNVSRT
jgi:hypothetical protein